MAQINTPIRNQNSNSIELEKKQSKKVLEREPVEATNAVVSNYEAFTLNVRYLKSELNNLALSSTRKTPTPKQQKQFEAQLKYIKSLDHKSFDYHLLNYQVGNYDFSRIKSLKTAAKIKPLDFTVLKELSAYYYIIDDQKDLSNHLIKIDQQGYFSSDLIAFATNTLLSLPKKSVLVSHGEQDTYPLLIQQKIKNIRSDVEIISLEHLQSEDYRKKLKKQGMKMPNTEIIDTHFFDQFLALNKNHNIVVASTLPKPYLMKVEGIANAGLGFAYESSVKEEYNLNIYHQLMKQAIQTHIDTAKDQKILVNYLPYLFSVRNQMMEIEDQNSVREIELLIYQIGRASNTLGKIKKIMK
ncbi:hypothetical protein DXU93_11740 [Brumimicrobium aurantiacum]|uniref:Uncharacterized protein n=2 Tax=Brumimicrobium aurantiacum TaxID=1737063 RepID=A0A3E1EW96_9FLAO|nr:hypothetical protein DXU93_11740 [Brumimicrobium aurantiacum]